MDYTQAHVLQELLLDVFVKLIDLTESLIQNIQDYYQSIFKF